MRREQWRLVTSLLDHVCYLAGQLVTLYRERWQAETGYASLKATLLDGRVLRSGHPADLDQEIWGILTVYQAVIRAAAAACASGGLDMDRLSFSVALDTARDQVTLAAAVFPGPGPAALTGAIGTALLGSLLPARHRQRMKARSLKSASKYAANIGKHPAIAQGYTFRVQVMVMEEGLAPRPRR